MPFCSNCGRKLAENENCNCQAQNTNQTSPSVYTQNTGEPQVYNSTVVVPPKKNKSWIIILLVVLLLIFIMVVGLLALILVPAMIGYVSKSKTAYANSAAKTIAVSANSALADMEIDNININGLFLISNEKDKNFNADYDDVTKKEPFNESVFYDYIESYYTDIDNFDWFVVVENGVVTYSAAAAKSNDDYIGTYPKVATPREGPAYYDSYFTDEDTDFDELYKHTFSELYDKAE